MRAPAASRHFPARFRGTFRAPPALRRAPRSGLGEFWRVPNILYRISWGVFKLDKIIIPVNTGDRHWSLVVAYVQERKIKHYDSMEGEGGTQRMEALRVYLRGEALK